MTKAQTATIQAKWKQKVDLPVCAHPNLELEVSDSGYLTGNHHCIDCGETVNKKV